MSWELVKKHKNGPAAYGPMWKESPCIALSKVGISLNCKFCEVFDFRAKDLICIYVDKAKGRLGFKHPTNESDIEEGYVISAHKGSAHFRMSCSKLIKRIPETMWGKALPAHIQPGELMIEVILPSSQGENHDNEGSS